MSTDRLARIEGMATLDGLNELGAAIESRGSSKARRVAGAVFGAALVIRSFAPGPITASDMPAPSIRCRPMPLLAGHARGHG